MYCYPRPPRGGRRAVLPGAELPRRISIHALREEGDRWLYRMFHRYLISIHALREEGDFKGRVSAPRDFLFLSTPSARRATVFRRGGVLGARISIHALREEGDQVPCVSFPLTS